MALEHARPLEPIDVRPLGATLAATQTHSLIKSRDLQLMRLVLRACESLPPHHVGGEVTLQCLEGHVQISIPGRRIELKTGEVVLLPAGEEHDVQAQADSSVLVTISLAKSAA